jgi:hypothetical protein
MNRFQYIRQSYGVCPFIGQGVVVDGKPGIIVEDRGRYLGVNFESDKPGVVSNCHPTWRVEYGQTRKIRKPSKSAKRYMQWLDESDMWDIDFGEWLRRGYYKETAV